jgi:hypothetical protein
MGRIDWEEVEKRFLELIMGLLMLILLTLLFKPVDDKLLRLIFVTATIIILYFAFKYGGSYVRKHKKTIITILLIVIFTLLIYLPDRDADMWEQTKKIARLNQNWIAGTVEFTKESFDPLGRVSDSINITVLHQLEDGELRPIFTLAESNGKSISQNQRMELWRKYVKPYSSLASESVFFQPKDDIELANTGEVEYVEGVKCRKYSYYYEKRLADANQVVSYHGYLWLDSSNGVPVRKSAFIKFPEKNDVSEIYEDIIYEFSEGGDWYAKKIKIVTLKKLDDQIIEERMNLILSDYFQWFEKNIADNVM